MTNSAPKIAIIYDQSSATDNDRHVLTGLHAAFPAATLFISPVIKSRITKTLDHFYPKRQLNWFKKLDLSRFDVIISYGNHAKHVHTSQPGQRHIHYGHEAVIIPALKYAESQAVQGIDTFIATSSDAQQAIKTHYGQFATIINPPIDVNLFIPARQRSNQYVVIDNKTPNKPATVDIASMPNLGIQLTVLTSTDSEATIRTALNSAKGFISLKATSFDCRQVEALAAGAPVIAYGKGGALDIVQDGESGILFNEQTVDSLVDAIKRAEAINFLPGTLRRKAKRFDTGLFVTKIHKIVSDNISTL